MQGALRTQHGEHSCPVPESRHLPQVSKAPPVPPGPSGGLAQLNGREVAQGPRGEKQKGLAESQGLPEGQSLLERQRRVREAPPGGARQVPKNTTTSPSTGITMEPRP